MLKVNHFFWLSLYYDEGELYLNLDLQYFYLVHKMLRN